MRSGMRLTVPALAALLVAACSTVEPGAPVAGDRSADSSAESPTESPTESPNEPPSTSAGSPSGTRPKAFDMAGLDVCQLLGELPVRTFGLDGDRPPIAGESAIFPGSKDCYTGGIRNNLGLTLIAVTDEGAPELAESANAEVAETDVAGYRVFVLTPKDPGGCFGAVDVNDGQLLFINFGQPEPGADPVTPQAQLCGAVPDIAAAALTALAT